MGMVSAFYMECCKNIPCSVHYEDSFSVYFTLQDLYLCENVLNYGRSSTCDMMVCVIFSKEISHLCKHFGICD